MIALDVNTLVEMGAAALAICALSAVLALSLSMRRLRRRSAAVEASLAAMRRELEVMAAISLRTGSRVSRMERECSGVADRIESIELRGPSQCFDQAIDFARRGTDSGKLTQQFGLSRAEADLVTRLHGRKKTA
jgi:type II secretory pathway component PulJ